MLTNVNVGGACAKVGCTPVAVRANPSYIFNEPALAITTQPYALLTGSLSQQSVDGVYSKELFN
jgi:hypothetical protein